MDNPFLYNGALTLVSSLNRVPLMGLGGIPLSESVRGKTMNEIVIAPNHPPKELGRAIALMLLALLRGDPENRAAFSIWDDSHWEWWRGVKRVYLGGGRLSDAKPVLEGICSMFDEAGQTPPCELIVPENAANLPLFGAARYAIDDLDVIGLSGQNIGVGYDCVLSFDFGHTNVKRGLAAVGGGITALDPIPAQYTSMSDEFFTTAEGERLHRFIVSTISATSEEARRKGFTPAPKIGISIANYVQKGGGLIRRGGYGKLLLLGESYTNVLTSALAGEMLYPLLIHDGTAAAYAVGKQDRRCAVITFGTSIGVGFATSK